MEIIGAQIGRSTRIVLENIAKHPSFKRLLDISNDKRYSDADFRRLNKQDSREWSESLSLISVTVIMECARILSVPPDKLKSNFDEEMSDVQKSPPLFARNFLEYCFFRAIAVATQSRNHLSDKNFRKWTFDMFLAWEFPNAETSQNFSETVFHNDSACMEAYTRLSPLIHLTADCITVHDQFEILTVDTGGRLTYDVYNRFLKELDKALKFIHDRSPSLTSTLGIIKDEELIIAVENNAMEPILQHVGVTSWPGRLTLSNQALYFEPKGDINHDVNKQFLVCSRTKYKGKIENECDDESDYIKTLMTTYIKSIIRNSSISCAGCHISYTRENSNPLSKTKLGSRLKKSMQLKITSPVLVIFPSEPLSIPIPNLPSWRVKPKSRLAWKQNFGNNTSKSGFRSCIPIFSFNSESNGTLSPEPLILEFSEPYALVKREFWLLAIREMISVHDFIRNQNFEPENKCRVFQRSIYGVARLKAIQNLQNSTSHNFDKLLTFSSVDAMPHNTVIIDHIVDDCLSTESPNIFRKQDERWKAFPQSKSEEIVPHSPSDIDTGTILDMGDSECLEFVTDSESGASLGTKDMESLDLDLAPDSSLNNSSGINIEYPSTMRYTNDHVGQYSLVELTVMELRKKEKEFESQKLDYEIFDNLRNHVTLVKELCILFFVLCQYIHSLVTWKEPTKTIVFIVFVTYFTFRNWLCYVAPSLLLFNALFILWFRLRSYFSSSDSSDMSQSEIMIFTPPELHIIQKILILNRIRHNLPKWIQFVNVSLMRIQSLLVCESAQASDPVVLLFLVSACVLVFLPFRLVFICLFWEVFTRGLRFRREHTKQVLFRIKEWWLSIPVKQVRFVNQGVG